MDNHSNDIHLKLDNSQDNGMTPVQVLNKRLQEQKNTIDSKAVETERIAESQFIKVNLHIGIFFDGTNNNKVQSMLALSDRRKQFYKRYRRKLKDLKINSYEDMLAKERDFFCNYGVGSIAELDSIFGSSNKFDLFMERSIATDNESEYRQASSADDLNEKSRNSLKEIAGIKDVGKKSTELFMGGGNSAGASNYTNIAILSSLYETSENKKSESDKKDHINRYYSIYVEGVGTTDELNLIKNIARLHKSVFGLGFGVGEDGLSNKCKQATKRILNIVESFSSKDDVAEIYCYFDVFGFSRGAATARAFTHILNPNDIQSIENKYLNVLLTGTEEQFLKKNSKKVVHKEIQTLGLYDTVSSIGILREECTYLLGDKILNIGKQLNNEKITSFFHDTNVIDFGLYSTDQATKVLHICALDEFRKNFALVNIESSINSCNGLEIFIPGCHTDIGGGSKLGLDNPKIINLDEIATKGKILYLFYVRVNGLIIFLNSSAEILAKLSHPELLMLPSGEITNPKELLSGPLGFIKKMIKDLNTSVSGLFALITGYENLAEYDASEGKVPPKSPTIENHHSALYNWAAESWQAITNDIPNNIENVPPTIIKEYETFCKFVSKDDFLEKIQNGIDLVKGIVDIVNLYKNVEKKVKSIFNGLKDLIKAEQGTRWKGIKYEIDAFVKNEIEEWELLAQLSEDTGRMIELIFKEKHEDFVIPLEHRRICMYTGGNPYGKIENDKIKPMCIKTLKDAGWLPETLNSTTRKTFFSGRATKKDLLEAMKNETSVVVDGTKVAFATRQNILIYKYCKPGYSNLPLKAMYEWANSEKFNMFANYPANAFPIPNDLKEFYNQLSSTIKQKTSNREYCVPDISKYKELRCNYLHFSINQQVKNIGDNGLINGPSFKTISSNLSKEDRNILKETVLFEGNDSYLKDSLIARRIYVGKNPSETAGGKEYNAYDISKTKWLFD